MKNNKKSFSKRCEKNPMWKGNSVGYGELHSWVKERIKKPTLCPICKTRKAHDLVNISNVINNKTYNRDLSNWSYMCRRCHMESDGRLDKFLMHRRSTKKGNKLYLLVKNRPVGEKHKSSKLTEKKVIEIRSMYTKENTTLMEIAKKYNVCFQSVSLIVNRKTWKHI